MIDIDVNFAVAAALALLVMIAFLGPFISKRND